MEIKRQQGETDSELIYRVCSMKSAIGKWEDVADVLNRELGLNYTESRYRKMFQSFGKLFEGNKSVLTVPDEQSEYVEKQLRKLEEEKVKIQTEKLEYGRLLRQDVRDKMIEERIVDAVKAFEESEHAKNIERKFHSAATGAAPEGDTSAILCFGDEHYGTEFQILDLDGKVINAYSPEIFEDRMAQLLSKTLALVEKERIPLLRVFELGDFADGILRVSQLQKLRYGVVEQTEAYAEILSRWLNELTKYVNVDFQMCYGNHTELRMLGQPKGTFEKDNTGLFVKALIKAHLKNNRRFNFTENPTGLIFDEVQGFNVLGFHGDMKTTNQMADRFMSLYAKPIDVLINGHHHQRKEEGVARNGRCHIGVPSIIGTDDFSMSLMKTTDAGATMIFLTKGEGLTQKNNILLR